MEPAMTTVILAIDTATPAVTAGIVRRDGENVEVLAEQVTVDARAHAERLTPNIVGALAGAGLTVENLDAIVVGCGPGPFTGLRVGMATAAAYGHALGIPVHGVCSLDAIGIESAGSTTGTACASTGPRSARLPTCQAPQKRSPALRCIRPPRASCGPSTGLPSLRH
jgi:tRNA threonylcarbamoyl adenosine modification protein YeaZ